MKHPCKRLTALLLALAMSLSLLSMTAWAAEPEADAEVSASDEAEPEEEAAEEESEAEPEEEAAEEEPEAEPEEEAANSGISVASEDGIATASTVESGSCGDNATYTLDENGVLTISGTGEVDVSLYEYNDSILTVIVESGITSIGECVFDGCDNLTNVTIGDSVTSIGESAFYGCTSLTSVTIPDSVTTIGDCAFYECTNLTSVTIPDSVTSIGEHAFAWCESLTSVTIGGGAIGNYAFCWCDSLTSVTIGDSVTSIGDYVFYDNQNLTSVTIPDSVTSIGEFAFAWCENLTSVTIGSGVTTIGDYAFDDTNLTSVTIPDSVTTIGDYAFAGTCLTSVIIPDSVTSLGDGAFCDCESLTGVTIGSGIIAISDYAFQVCYSLTSVTIPASVTSIGEYAFDWCDSLTDIYYGSTEDDWNAIDIEDYNDPLLNATIHYNSTGPSTVTLDTPVITLTTIDGGVTVKWGSVTGASKYLVYRRTTGSTSGWEELAYTTSTSYTDTTAVSGTVYYYTVRAISGSYRSAYQKDKGLKYLATPSLSVANASSGVTVKWGSVAGASKYLVLRRTAGSTSGWEELAYTTSTSYTDTTAVSGTVYYYTVRAISGSYRSAYQKDKGLKYLATPSLSVANASSGVTVKWGSVAGASKYLVLRRTAGSTSGWQTLASTTSTSYTDTTAVNGTIYYYTVKALNGKYLSGYESDKAIVRLTTPTLSSVTNSASKTMTVKWSKASGITGYQIRYSTSSSFAKSTTVTVSNASTVSTTISGLTKGSTYYVVVRTYKILSGKVSYSAWSSAKTVKISK